MKLYINAYAGLRGFFPENYPVEIHRAQSAGAKESINAMDLRAALIEVKPEAANILNFSRFARNDEFIQDESELSDGDKIDIIPPVSGG
jgi:molybdopterin converting factor small subunit